MTRTADVPAREPVSSIRREATLLGLEPQPETLRSRAALLYERIYDSLIPCHQVEKLPRLRVALNTVITLCAEHAAARHLEEDFPAAARPFPHPSRARANCTSRAPALRCTEVYGFAMVPADPGGIPPYDQSTQHKTQRTPPPPHRRGYRHHPRRRARRNPPSAGGFPGRFLAVSAPVARSRCGVRGCADLR